MHSFLGLQLLISLLLYSCTSKKEVVFIEAENFTEKGGWVVDAQFAEQMGSPYLMAHGLGIPVANAYTKLRFPSPGKYHVWVRTMNWAPGNWDAPGRFSLLVNGKEMNTVLGTIAGWTWQYAGRVQVDTVDCKIELKDITGFNGRCDAIFFSTVKQAPPNEPSELKKWRTAQMQEGIDPEKTQNFDLVIVGGGIAGCAAAIAAAEQGLQVALIHDRPVLGGNASSEIRVHTLGITWHYDRILKMLNTAHYPNGSPEAVLEDNKRMENIRRYKNISLFLNWRAYGVKAEDDSITSVDARQVDGNGRMRFTAPLYIDCTGDGWIGFWAGAEYMYGREDSSKHNETWSLNGELWSPGKADNRVMGSSVLWRTRNAGKQVAFPEVPWALEIAKDFAAINGEWYWEYSNNDYHQVDDAEKIRDHMLKAIFGSFYNAKKLASNDSMELEWVSYLLGKRESRRLVGDYIYTFQDARQMIEFPDAVVMEKREIDVHYQQNIPDKEKPDFLSEALYYHVDHYYVPYRSLYSKNIKNLFMAGRCFSCTHVGLGGPRVMNTTGQMGAAVGYAASLAVKYDTGPRGVYEKHLTELKNLIETSNDFK
ncbi:MAG: FAD-dependent oxidoreductase [Bacteroidales bacterium]